MKKLSLYITDNCIACQRLVQILEKNPSKNLKIQRVSGLNEAPRGLLIYPALCQEGRPLAYGEDDILRYLKKAV